MKTNFLIFVLTIIMNMALIQNYEVGQVENCKLSQCIPLTLDPGKIMPCPDWDYDCINLAQAFSDCINGDDIPDCVTGREILKTLSDTDQYPKELINCTLQCQYPQKAYTYSSFYENYLYQCRYGCEKNMQPIYTTKMATKQDFITCKDTCEQFYNEQFLERLAYFEDCSERVFFENSQTEFTKLDPSDLFPYNLRASYFWCQYSPSQPYDKYDNWYNCMTNCQIQSVPPAPTYSTLMNYGSLLLVIVIIQLIATIF